MNVFTRTPSGQSAYWFFNPKAILYVEGRSDIHFYEGLIRGIKCKIEKLNGEKAGKRIEQEILHNHAPYIVCYDGDYAIFDKERSPHRQIIRLSRYSFENYFWREDLLNIVACNFAGVQVANTSLVQSEFSRINTTTKKLCQLVELDITNRKKGIGVEVFPKSIHAIAKSTDPIRLCATKLAARRQKIAKIVQKNHAESHCESCEKYHSILANVPAFHTFNGHFVLSVAKQIIINAVRRRTGSSLSCKENILGQLLGNALWGTKLDDDLRRLRNRLRKVLTEITRRYPQK